MRKCIKIIVYGKVKNEAYQTFIQKQALVIGVEGTIKNNDDESVIIHACGTTENLDTLIDYVYKGASGSHVDDVHIEPFINEKDFRGVFRVIV